jgi:hypothetical protein
MLAVDQVGPLHGHFRDTSRRAFGISEVFKLQLNRLEILEWLNGRCRAGCCQDASGYRARVVRPKAEQFDCDARHSERYRSENAGFCASNSLPEFLAFAKQPAAGDSTQPPRNNRSVHLYLVRLARLRISNARTRTERILRHLVAMTDHVEPRLASHQFRQVEGDHAALSVTNRA